MSDLKIFTINPGSTSTKIALFCGETELFSKNIPHDAKELAAFLDVSDQKAYRSEAIRKELSASGIGLSDVDAYVGRGGGLLPVEGGVYRINDIMLLHAKSGRNGVRHPASLGPLLAHEFAGAYGKPAFVVDPPDTDEYQDLARITGIREIQRKSHIHALNQKETARRHAASLGRTYEDCNFIVCHLGGGISVAAHQKGRMIDGNDIAGGEGPLAPTRCGDIPAAELIRYCFESGKSKKDVLEMTTKTGGFVSYFGTSDARAVKNLISEGNGEARLLWDAMIYQIVKSIGSMAAVLNGCVDGILLGGGLACDDELVGRIKESCAWIAPVTAYPGEFEMEAMARGARRVLNGEEPAKEYGGSPLMLK